VKEDAINHKHQWFGGHSYAQHGDDFAILNLFKRFNIERPSYLDIGAHHPYELSNTALLYARGSRGINVDANADAIGLFKQERPDDANVWSAILHPRNIGTEPYTTLYRVNETSGVNTTVEGGLRQFGGPRDQVRVPAHTVEFMVHKYANNKFPDLLTIDAEGRDLEILESIDWDRHDLPKVICVEARAPAGDIATDLRLLMYDKHYYCHSWCGFNMLFVPVKFKHLLH
jgi:FkbM family methyltransferase